MLPQNTVMKTTAASNKGLEFLMLFNAKKLIAQMSHHQVVQDSH